MIDMIHKICQTEECEKQSKFGLELGKPLVCSTQHDEGMSDVIHKKCKNEECNTQPSNMNTMDIAYTVYASFSS